MKLSLQNIGKIKQASVEINGITVIAGENNTGKSTVGKVLYSVFNSFYNIDKQIRTEKIQSIENTLDLIYRNATSKLTSMIDFEELTYYIINNADKFECKDQLGEEIIKAFEQYNVYFKTHEEIDEPVNRIYEILAISDEEVIKVLLDKHLETEFYEQINNIFTKDEAKVNLQIRDKIVNISIVRDTVLDIKNSFDLQTEVLYFDDPFILDDQKIMGFFANHSTNHMDHRTHLKSKLFAGAKDSNVIDEIVVNNKFQKIYNKINEICDGNIVNARRNFLGYKKNGTGKVLDVRNLSTGLKTFVILKTLLENGTIKYNGTIILDEPEIHLHPEWQLLFAELIVLIQKEFDIHILLNTHSPYFLNAIEVYAAKHEIADKCKFYLAIMDGESSCLEDVTNNIEIIYSKLARPLQDLENERYRND